MKFLSLQLQVVDGHNIEYEYFHFRKIVMHNDE